MVSSDRLTRDPAATGGDDIPARLAWSTSSTTRTGDLGVAEQIDAGAHTFF